MANGDIQKRGVKRRQIKPVVLIVTEGARTEPSYFNSFRSKKRNLDIHVVGGGTGRGTDYASLVRKAIDYMDKNGLSTKSGDALWVVADADVNYNIPNPIATKNRQLEMAKKTAARRGIRIALSNPCFEFWFLLHFKYSSAYLRDYPATLRELQAYIPSYEKAAEVSRLLVDHTEQAIINAKQLESYHKEVGCINLCDIDVNPCTGVHRLVEIIWEKEAR